MDFLERIFNKQYELNKRILKERHGQDYDQLCDPENNDPQTVNERVKWLLNYNRALIHESIEMEDSLPWKWWKDMDEIDWENIRIELIDELHFWVSKCQLAGLDPQKLTELYLKKNQLNQIRQDKGYGSTYSKYDENGVEDNKRMDEIFKEEGKKNPK
ncbi:dUTPase [candidate division KSB1 bacterium]|jgi:dimeric dUTPase (all-alpha-NTP-PPase superfamily)|nr:MAG: dUTPase [candidate division KSB1 bacterium]